MLHKPALIDLFGRSKQKIHPKPGTYYRANPETKT